MKKMILLISAACISLPVFANPDNLNNPAPSFKAPAYSPGYAPNYNRNRGSNWNTPNFNMGNNRRGSNWNMPNMNWGNNRNNFGSGSNWNMPNMNWGNNRGGSGSNFSMPNMGWGNNRGGSGSNFSMPNMGWGNNRGSNWNMPGFNSGSNNPPPGYWGPNQNFNSYVQPNRVQPNRVQPNRMPSMPAAPGFPKNRMMKQAPVAKAPAPSVQTAPKAPNAQFPSELNTSVPMPSEIKGVILAPPNKPEQPIQKPGK